MGDMGSKQNRTGFDPWVLASDPVFYAVVIFAVTGVILFALSGEQETRGFSFDGRHLIVEGEALAHLVPGPGTESEYLLSEEAARITANASFEQAGRLSAGVGLLLPRAFEEDVIGRRVEVEIELRAMNGNPNEVLVAYFTAGSGDSRRHRVSLSQDWQVFSFSHVVPETAVANDQEWIGIWPDLDGLERPVLVRRIEARILNSAE